MESCCGCGICEAVCPVENCITMVNEAAFDDNASQWDMWRKDKGGYRVWMEAKITDKVHIGRSHGFRYRGQYEEELSRGELEMGGAPLATGVPGENATNKGLVPAVHEDKSSSIITGVAEAPGG